MHRVSISIDVLDMDKAIVFYARRSKGVSRTRTFLQRAKKAAMFRGCLTMRWHM